MSDKREKDIRKLMYIKNEIIKQEKKQLKELRKELEQIQGKGKVKIK